MFKILHIFCVVSIGHCLAFIEIYISRIGKYVCMLRVWIIFFCFFFCSKVCVCVKNFTFTAFSERCKRWYTAWYICYIWQICIYWFHKSNHETTIQSNTWCVFWNFFLIACELVNISMDWQCAVYFMYWME